MQRPAYWHSFCLLYFVVIGDRAFVCYRFCMSGLWVIVVMQAS